jgi:hypothetical protein
MGKYELTECDEKYTGKLSGTNWGTLTDKKNTGKMITRAESVNYQIVSGNNNTFIYNKGKNRQIYSQ